MTPTNNNEPGRYSPPVVAIMRPYDGIRRLPSLNVAGRHAGRLRHATRPLTDNVTAESRADIG